MCGIAGIVSAAEPPDLELLRRMTARLAHRGPDGHGHYRDRRAALGHVRLAVIDTVGGAQPMSDEDGALWVTFNGEIYNYVELRRELRGRGHRFRTDGDTEVVVHAYAEWGRTASSDSTASGRSGCGTVGPGRVCAVARPIRGPAALLHG